MNYLGLLLTFSSLIQVAQTPIPECKPPQQNQYLVLVRTATEQSQSEVKRTLASTPIGNLVCDYQGEIVTRVGEFSSLQDAQKWADYFSETVKLSAYVAISPDSEMAKEDFPPFQPQILGNGYAVLIDYFNRPEVATQVKDLLGRDIGLAVYVSRPYLLAIQTSNEREAQFILQKLSEKGFWAIAVDSRLVTRLTPKVKY
jgi:hypothetical protein